MANMGTTRSQGSYHLSPPPTKVSAQLAHRELRKALFTLQERPLVADMGATWWQGSYGVPPPPTQLSTRLAHIQLRNSKLSTDRRSSHIFIDSKYNE